MKKGWYILNYHNIGWEENDLSKGIGGNFPPDIFHEHLEYLSRFGNLLSVQDAFQLYKEGKINEPVISLWFDDGLKGVRKYAYPILESFKTKAAMSINSKFTLRQEMFWRFKLSFLNQVDGMRFLRSKIRKYGYKNRFLMKNFVMDNFQQEILDAIDTIYHQFTEPYFREDAFRIFDTVEGIKELHENGWEIANHSASHYPIGEPSYFHKFGEEFIEAENSIQEAFNIKTRYWVLPFAREKGSDLVGKFRQMNEDNRHLVLVGDRINRNYTKNQEVIYRIYIPDLRGKELIKRLKKLVLS